MQQTVIILSAAFQALIRLNKSFVATLLIITLLFSFPPFLFLLVFSLIILRTIQTNSNYIKIRIRVVGNGKISHL